MTEQGTPHRPSFWRVIGRIAESPGLTMGAGVVLLVTAGWEIIEGVGEEFSPGAHHGLAVFGLVQVVAALPHCLHGIKQMHESHHQRARPAPGDEKPSASS